ncbi:NAD(P)/FAD-dependent oxidoreductase [Blastopirellula sp. JC732]|uniref:NAD(P)/FAD-dependent oxidoreductase n=1 Tax=Blastopirellula sediminis TaxID=2894196 RepID=A0A9X1MPM8_9BACT|nr:NAD(P)/FAD-dependent oxidoreductase [Blastopirellula sediminis]MCC9606281.1 NAD(P)/FAD-dependent oxidoreductase [Blastopirellula sediminis]MCC9630421.1 NAD(P)/FAD-dependent oxidoreductase [Blastopirellula sediminis]
MNFGTSYKQNPINGSYDVIVIGSGIGGLGAAALLAKHGGKRVLVLERHYTAGGFTHTFRRPGYEWDVGVHYIGDIFDLDAPLRTLLDDVTDAQLEWADMGEVYDRIIIGDQTYDFVKGRENFRQRLHDYFPNERTAIDRYLQEVDATSDRARMFFAEKALPVFLSRLVGGLMRWPLLRKAKRTTLETLSSLTSDKQLIGVLTGQFGDYGLPPGQSSFFIHAMIAKHYLEGAAYPVGGASRFAATMLPVIEQRGGAVYTNAEVGRILVENDRAVGVELADGNQLRAPWVVSDAGALNTFQRLLPPETSAAPHCQRLLRHQSESPAHISLYIGLRETAEQLGLSKPNLWVYRDYDHDRNFARIQADPNAPLPVAYISFPSAKDPDFEQRYPGRATIEVISVAPYAWFAPWASDPWKKRGDEYEALKEQLTGKLLEQLYACCPQVEGRIDYAELSTPLSTEHFMGHPHGMIYGLAATPARFAERWLRPQTPLRNLYLTGTDICTLGIAGALFGGFLTASAILGKNLMPAVAKGAKRAQARKTKGAATG